MVFYNELKKAIRNASLWATSQVASVVGVNLFDAELTTLTKKIRQAEEKLIILPKLVWKKAKSIDEDF